MNVGWEQGRAASFLEIFVSNFGTVSLSAGQMHKRNFIYTVCPLTLSPNICLLYNRYNSLQFVVGGGIIRVPGNQYLDTLCVIIDLL
jgi:hypothetical protein